MMHSIAAHARGDAHGRLGTFAWIVALIATTYSLVITGEYIMWDANWLAGAGTIGAEQAQLVPAPDFARGFVTVADVSPESPLAGAGVVPGDHLRFFPVYDYLRYRWAGEDVHAILDHHGVRRAITMISVPRTSPANWPAVRFDVGNFIPALFGVFIVLRSRRNKAAALLGIMLGMFGVPSISAELWEGRRSMFVAFSTLDRACIASVGVFMVAFAMLFLSQRSSKVTRRHWNGLAAYVVLCVLAVGVWSYCSHTVTTIPLIGDGSMLFSVVGMAGYIASLVYLILAWRASITLERERSALLLVGVAAMVVAQIISYVVFLWLAQMFTANSRLLPLAELLSGVVAPVCLTYAILKYRVLDLGFVLNRTLVYGTVSAILLITFGLVEWAIDHLVTINGREKNALVDAAIALGVYLTFHKVRDRTEHAVESLFFHSWKEAESRLRNFVAKAAHFTTRDSLIAAFLGAASRFADGADAALYLEHTNGGYMRAGGVLSSAPAMFDANDAIIVDLRSEPAPRVTETGIAIPVVNRHDVTGMLLLGAKPTGASFRPDEIDLLNWAAQQIGMDIQALAVDQLRVVTDSQAQEIAILRARDDLYRALTARA